MNLSSGRPDDLSPQKRALLELLLQERDAAAELRIPRRAVVSPAPQSFAQRRLWMLEALRPGTPVYTVRTALRLAGGVDHAALRRAVNEVVRRHESLRTTFTLQDGAPVQVIADSLVVDLPVVEVQGSTHAQREAALSRCSEEELARPFDLERGPLFRTSLLRLGPDDHVLLVTLHHIVADGWSLGVLLRELSALYPAFARGEPSPLPELAIQYADYAVWQHEQMATPALRGQLAHWREEVADLPALVLPTDRPRPPVPGMAGERQQVILSREVSDGLAALSQREGTTLYMTLLAALQVVLARWSGQDVFGVGTPIANRNRAETEDLIGFFLNTLVLRADLTGDPTFRDLLARVRETTLAAYANQDLPFERLLEAVRPARDTSRTPLFGVFFNMLNFADERLNRPAVVADAPATEDFAQFDLTLYAGQDDHRLTLHLVHSTDLFDRSTASRVLGYLSTLLGAVVADPDRRVSALPIVSAEQRRALAARRTAARPGRLADPVGAPEAAESLPQRLAEQVRLHPERVAVRSRGTDWTYRELAERASLLARAVRAAAPGPAGRVGVLCGHDTAMVAALLGVLSSGHAYVPLDPAHPEQRLAQIVADAQLAALVADGPNLPTARSIAAGLPVVDTGSPAGSGVRLAAELPAVGPDAVAYLLYTSGSTGRPKGVLQSHRNVLAHIRAYTRGLHIGAHDRLSMLAPVAFDAAVMDIYGALLTGATLCLYDVRDEGLLGIPRWLAAQAVTVYHSTPTVFRQAFEGDPGQPLPALRAVVLGGEELLAPDVETFRRWAPRGAVLVNGLGPTESTLALQYVVDGRWRPTSRSVPVGFPVEGTDVLLRNEAGEEVDVYGVGTIVVRSPHVALGYWRRPELTRSAFEPDALDARARCYVTGDLGRLLPDGAIEFAGRRDGQLKIRGHRVEAGEVEARLLEHPAVRAALVTVAEHPAAGQVLVAHVLADPTHTGAAGPAALRAFLRERLPASMLPAAVVPVAAFPLTANGKVDRRALPEPDFTASSAATHVAARTPLERTLASLVAGVLGRPQVGVTDDFFELGGHSLLATQLLARIRAELALEVPLRAVFQEPSVAGLARLIEAGTLPPTRDGGSTITAQPRPAPTPHHPPKGDP